MASFFKALKKHWLLWGGLGLLVALFGFLAANEFQRWIALRQELTEREKEIRALEQETGQLSLRLERVSDPAFLEKEARRKLNLKAENEEVFVVVGLESITQPEDFSGVFDSPEKKRSPLTQNVVAWYRYFVR